VSDKKNAANSLHFWIRQNCSITQEMIRTNRTEETIRNTTAEYLI
jgi:hypothetical protein